METSTPTVPILLPPRSIDVSPIEESDDEVELLELVVANDSILVPCGMVYGDELGTAATTGLVSLTCPVNTTSPVGHISHIVPTFGGYNDDKESVSISGDARAQRATHLRVATSR